MPADTAVALGAFLAHRGVTTLPMVFAVTLGANMLGAAGVYFAARRYGRQLFATPVGRRLLAPRSIAAIEREYLRFGIFGIFLARFLPGIRAVVAPFAGLVNLSPARALIPMAAASAIWYGCVTLIGSAIGAEWDRISSLIGGINRTLGYVTVAILAVIGVVIYLRRRQRMREPVWGAFRRAFGDDEEDVVAESPEDEAQRAMRSAALLLLELAYAEEALTQAERIEVEAHLRQRWGLEPAANAAAPPGEHPERSRLGSYRQRIVDHFAHERRLALVERLWHVAFSERTGHRTRDHLVRRAADLLGLTPEEVSDVESRVRRAGR